LGVAAATAATAGGEQQHGSRDSGNTQDRQGGLDARRGIDGIHVQISVAVSAQPGIWQR
jgi:hypothetical protein